MSGREYRGHMVIVTCSEIMGSERVRCTFSVFAGTETRLNVGNGDAAYDTEDEAHAAARVWIDDRLTALEVWTNGLASV